MNGMVLLLYMEVENRLKLAEESSEGKQSRDTKERVRLEKIYSNVKSLTL